jgi:rhamnose transport system permease protein
MTTLGNDPSRPGGLPSPGTLDPDAVHRAGHPIRRIATALAMPEPMVALLLIVVFTWAALTVPHFLEIRKYLLPTSSLYMETGFMALAMTFVIIGGHIDLSCAGTLALVCTLVPWLNIHAHINIWVLAVAGLFMGTALGAFNGWLVAVLGLPSLVVTLGTMAAYRGLAQLLAGDRSLPVPGEFQGIDNFWIANRVPVPLFMFLALALAAGIVLHKTIIGRWVYALGTNEQAARYAGVPVRNTLIGLFAASGLLSALGGLTMISRLGYARYDYAKGAELDVITAVVLGGASILGGRGTIIGTAMALFLIAILQESMGVASVSTGFQKTASGALLILAVLASNMMARLRR